MIDKANIDKTNAWPFVEAKKILKERKKNIENKGKIARSTVIVDKQGIVRYSVLADGERIISELLAECTKINS